MNCKVITKGVASLMVKRFLGPFWIRRHWLKKTQWLRAGELEQIQLRLLKRLVFHCDKTVPYYHQLMDERDIAVESIKTLEDIKQFPILTKKNVLQASDSIVSTKYPKWMMTTGLTGGTTGTPLSLPRSLFSVENEHAFVRRQWDWAGISFLDNAAYLSGRVIVDVNKTRGRLYAYDPFMRELILSTYHLSVETAKQFAEAIKQYQVKAIVGYASSICFLAKACINLGLKLKLKAALTTSETINNHMRDTIAEGFGCKVFDFYGAAERVCYIFTCERGSYHIIPEYGLTELIPVDSVSRNICKIVSTGFWNYAMPFLRYDTGDIVVKSEESCSCGRQFQVIKSISGRQADSIRTPSGREFGAAILTHLLYGTDHILESQIVQDTLDHVTIQYVPTENFSVQDMNNFKSLIAKHLPGDLKVDFKKVKMIKKTDCGKLKPVLTKIEGQVDHL